MTSTDGFTTEELLAWCEDKIAATSDDRLKAAYLAIRSAARNLASLERGPRR
jgi:hypothetical protein